jgi:putative flippase GtrA
MQWLAPRSRSSDFMERLREHCDPVCQIRDRCPALRGLGLGGFRDPVYGLRLDPSSQATSRIVGGLVSFGTNKYWSFQSYQHKQALHEAWRFAMLFIASYGLSLSLFSGLTYLAYLGTGPYWAKLITDTACFLFNFLVMRFWVYRPRRSASKAAEHKPDPSPGQHLLRSGQV